MVLEKVDYISSVFWTNSNPGMILIPYQMNLLILSCTDLEYNGTFWNFKLKDKNHKRDKLIQRSDQISVDILSNHQSNVGICKLNDYIDQIRIVKCSCSINIDENVSLLVIN